MTAYVDESLRLEGAGLYVLAAVLVPDGRANAVRATLRDALRRGQRRFHFRKQDDQSRLAMCALIRTLRVASVVVTCPLGTARPERGRRKCLLRLLWELDQRGVGAVLLESRQSANALDRSLIEQSLRIGWTAQLAYGFGLPDEEPLLWLPDAVAGAVRSAADGDWRYLDELGDAVTVVSAP